MPFLNRLCGCIYNFLSSEQYSNFKRSFVSGTTNFELVEEFFNCSPIFFPQRGLCVDSKGASPNLFGDLGLCVVSQAKCLLRLEQWSIVCLWMGALCLKLALDSRSAPRLLHAANMFTFQSTNADSLPRITVSYNTKHKTVMSQHI